MLLCLACAAVNTAPMPRHGEPWRLVASKAITCSLRDECLDDMRRPGRSVHSSLITDKQTDLQMKLDLGRLKVRSQQHSTE
jgi:hypothetical protein